MWGELFPNPTAPLVRTIGPKEVLVGTTATILADCSDVLNSPAAVTVYNNGPNSIWWCYAPAGVTPSITTTNAIELPAGAYQNFDGIGGLAVWAINTTPQNSGAGTRVAGGKT